jgi:putative membrane protein
MSYLDDPRVYFAAERTLLAWVRTGITAIGLGFVIARFGLFLRFIAPNGTAVDHRPGLSLIIGMLLVVVGALTCLGAAIQFQRFVRTLSEKELPPRYLPGFAPLIAYAFAVGGLLLTVYLAL